MRTIGPLVALAALAGAVLACVSAPRDEAAPSAARAGPIEAARAQAAARARPDRSAQTADFVLVDKSDRILVAYARGRAIRAFRGLQFGDAPKGHKHFEGDERTPEGRYVIDARNPNSAYHLSLRISYPNRADRAYAARHGRSPGGDIFIHGQPNWLAAGRLPGDWTDGCIALSNDEIEALWRLVPDGTPIVIRP